MERVRSFIPRDRRVHQGHQFICLMDVLWLHWGQRVMGTDVVVGHWLWMTILPWCTFWVCVCGLVMVIYVVSFNCKSCSIFFHRRIDKSWLFKESMCVNVREIDKTSGKCLSDKWRMSACLTENKRGRFHILSLGKTQLNWQVVQSKCFFVCC